METKKVVFVKWKDACTCREWINDNRLDAEFIDGATIIESIGFLMRDTKKGVLIASNLDDEYCCCTTFIPRSSILSMRGIKWKKKTK